jgi:DNA-directed RNA polymerase I, II, and III subunit RPABC2
MSKQQNQNEGYFSENDDADSEEDGSSDDDDGSAITGGADSDIEVDYDEDVSDEIEQPDKEAIDEDAVANPSKIALKDDGNEISEDEDDDKLSNGSDVSDNESDNESDKLSEDEDNGDKVSKSVNAKSIVPANMYSMDNDIKDKEDDDDDDEDVNYLQKFDTEINKNYILDYHPECTISNNDEIAALSVVVRDKFNNIIDNLHRTAPYLSKYERARILGQRAKQINSGAVAFVKVPEKVIDGYIIAELELLNKSIPFIIRRPLPNGGSEYWKLDDLENISF